MAQINELLGNVLVTVPGVPEPLAVNRYVDAARQFFRETQAWRVNAVLGPDGSETNRYRMIAPSEIGLPDPHTNSAASTIASVTEPVNVEVFDASTVTHDSKPLTKATREQVMREGKPSGSKPRWYRIEAGQLLIDPDPGEDVSAKLSASASLRPTRGATSLDDAIADRFGEIIENGAIARLLALPNRPWTNFDAASYYWKPFLNDVQVWRSRAADGGMQGVPRSVQYGGI